MTVPADVVEAIRSLRSGGLSGSAPLFTLFTPPAEVPKFRYNLGMTTNRNQRIVIWAMSLSLLLALALEKEAGPKMSK